MQTLTERVFHLAPPGGLFNETVVRNLFPDAGDGARAQFVHRAIRANEILRLKPGAYLLAPPFRRSEPHPFTIAAFLHAPSHVSRETALAWHGLIPEAVYQIGSVTAVRGRLFRTPVGIFSFERVPARDPRAGVRATRLEGGAWAFIATPLRAIADLVYLTAGIDWRGAGLAWLTESLRIDPDDLASLPVDDAEEIVASLRGPRVRAFIAGLAKAVADARRAA